METTIRTWEGMRAEELLDKLLQTITEDAVAGLPIQWLHQALCDIHAQHGMNGPETLLYAWKKRYNAQA